VKGDCALDQIVTWSPVFHSTIATCVSIGTCWTDGLVYSRSTTHSASANPLSTSPLRSVVRFAMLVPGTGVNAAAT
jgi:Ni,Fe-hydrogenase III small subunit